MNPKSQFRIFLSHRHEDQTVAAEIARAVEAYSGGRIHFYRSSDVAPGVDWRRWVREALNSTDLLLLLVSSRSDLSSSWDWSLYEVGLFIAATEADQRPVVALVARDLELPAPLASIRAVRATREEITRFLASLFRSRDFAPEPINSAISDDVLHELGSQIAEAFAPPAGDRSRLHANSLVLTVRADSLRNERVPGHAMIDANSQTLRLFGLLEGRSWKWGDLEGNVKGDRSWISELGSALEAILDDRLPREIRGKLQGADGRVYSPVIFRDEMRSSGIRRFHLLFVPTEGHLVDPKLVFVISAFRQETEAAFEAVHAAAKHHQLEARRVKDEVGDYRITDKILSMIGTARFLIADLTYERPNVYFELGYARGLAKTVITTARTGTQLHFDVKDWTYVEYDDSRNLERDLIRRLGIELGRETEDTSCA